MNDELEQGSLDLEDIIKEFSDYPEEPEQEEPVAEETEEVPEEAVEENLEQTRRIDPEQIHKAQKADDAWAQETRRIDPVRLWKKAPKNTDDTFSLKAFATRSLKP